jgi:hypothetical protein
MQYILLISNFAHGSVPSVERVSKAVNLHAQFGPSATPQVEYTDDNTSHLNVQC